MAKDSFIHLIPDALEPGFCRSLIDRFESDPRKYPGRVGSQAKVRPELRQATDLTISKLPEWRDADEVLFASLSRGLREYQERFPILKTFRLQDMGYILQRTRPGEKYDWHSDVAGLSTAHRQVIGLWYLNTVKEGGQTEFLEQDVKIQPRQGSLLLFPSLWTHVHRGATPISETKYTAISWICFA